MSHKISNDTLTLWKIKEIIDHNETITLSEESEKQVLKCREYLDSKMEDIGRPVYGVTTGFGSLCNITIPEERRKPPVTLPRCSQPNVKGAGS